MATKKFATPIRPADLEVYLAEVLQPLCSVFSSIALYQAGLDLLQRWHLSFYDALIVAAAIDCETPILYSEDLQHGQKIQGIEIVNPFL